MRRETTISHERYDNDDYDELAAKFITREKMNSMQERKSMTWAGTSVQQVPVHSLRISIPISPLNNPKPSSDIRNTAKKV